MLNDDKFIMNKGLIFDFQYANNEVFTFQMSKLFLQRKAVKEKRTSCMILEINSARDFGMK